MIFIQHIKTTWTKSSRGMPEASERLGIPNLLQLPEIPNQHDNNNLIIQEISTDRDSNVLKSIPVHFTNTKKRWDYYGLYFEQEKNEPEEVTVFFRYNHHGQPKRHNSQVFSFNKQTDGSDWGVLKINGRFTYSSGQFYRQHIFNVLFVEDINQIPKDIFFTTQPKRTQDFFANLF